MSERMDTNRIISATDKFILFGAVFILFFSALDPWFFWDSREIVNGISFIVLIYISFKYKFSFLKKTSINKCAIILYCIILLWMDGIKSFISPSFYINIIILTWIINLHKSLKGQLFSFIVKTFVLINSISLIAWILYLLGIPFPHTYVEYSVYKYDNYYFFLFNLNFINQIIPRFSGVIIEPGHLSMVSALLLYCNGMKLNKRVNLMLLIFIIFSFSLSGYILYITAYFYNQLIIKKVWKQFAIISMIFAFIVIPFTLQYNGGDNAINQLILARLEFEDGEMSGNNRNAEGFELFYKKNIKGEKLLLGIGNEKWSKIDYTNCSYKSFICANGLVGLFMLILLYICFIAPYSNKYTICLLLLYIMSFWQRPYALMRYELFIFILGIVHITLSNKLYKNTINNESCISNSST